MVSAALWNLVPHEPRTFSVDIYQLDFVTPGSCGYSGVPRLKHLCYLIESQLRGGTPAEELEPELLELLDEMDNVTRETKKMLG